MPFLFPHRDGGCGKIRIREAPNRDHDVAGKAFIFPEDSRTACGAEVIRYYVAALRSAAPGIRVTGKGNLFEAKARLVADHGAGTALAFQTMADSNAGWLAVNCESNLSATACGISDHSQIRTAVKLRSSTLIVVSLYRGVVPPKFPLADR